MTSVVLRSALLGCGYSDADLERLVRSGRLFRARRGAYTWAAGELSPEDRHRRLLAATLPQLRASGAVSHASAAVLHGLPVWPEHLARVHLTRPRLGGGKSRSLLRIHTGELADDEITVIDGIQTTTLLRTVADLARALPLEQAVAAGDAAARSGMVTEDLRTTLRRFRGHPGVGRAGVAAGLIDGRRESAGESVSRVRMHEAGLPVPEPQLVVLDRIGAFVARCDFGWPEHGVLGEFDGRVKYGRLLTADQDPGEVVYREKLREDALRDLGHRVVRWTWADLYPGTALTDRLGRALC